jgi:hypothetical protein
MDQHFLKKLKRKEVFMMKTKKLLKALVMSFAIFVCAGLAGIQAQADGGVHYLRAYQWSHAIQYYGSTEDSFWMSGQQYFNGLVKTSRSGYWDEELHAEFNLENSVDSVSFVVGHIDGAENGSGTMKIYLDGIYQSEYTKDLTYDMITQNVTIQTSGCSQLDIVIVCGDSYYGLGNITEVGKHNYSYEVTKVTTVNSDGEITYTCDDCGDTYTETDPAKKYCTDYLTPYETNMTVWDSTFGSSDYFSVMGVRCYRGLGSWKWIDNVALYNLDGQYESVTFTVGHVDNVDDSDDATLNVYIDGVEMKTIPLTRDMCSETYTIDTLGATQLKLEDIDYGYAIVDVIGNAVDKSPKEHSYEEETLIAAKFGMKGAIKHVCTVCGAFYTTETPAITRDLTDSAISVTLSKDQYAYDGKAKTPSVTVKYDGTKLKKGKDYTVSYSDNVNAGTATVTIKGKGFYKNSKQVTFSINPGKTSFSSIKNSKAGQVAVVLKKNAQASGYEIQYGKYSSFRYSATVDAKSKTSVMLENLTKGDSYYIRSRAYKTVNGVKIYGKYSTVRQITITK